MIIPIKTVVLSVFDKTGLADFVGDLHNIDPDITFFGSDGTVNHLKSKLPTLPVENLSQRLGHAQSLDGQVKTLDFSLYTAILLEKEVIPPLPIPPVDLIVCNLYPFARNYEEAQDLARARMLIDIGGVSLLRAGAKNYIRVTVLHDAADFAAIKEDLQMRGGVSLARRKELAGKVFSYTSNYDKLIADYFQPKGARHAS